MLEGRIDKTVLQTLKLELVEPKETRNGVLDAGEMLVPSKDGVLGEAVRVDEADLSSNLQASELFSRLTGRRVVFFSESWVTTGGWSDRFFIVAGEQNHEPLDAEEDLDVSAIFYLKADGTTERLSVHVSEEKDLSALSLFRCSKTPDQFVTNACYKHHLKLYQTGIEFNEAVQGAKESANLIQQQWDNEALTLNELDNHKERMDAVEAAQEKVVQYYDDPSPDNPANNM